MSFSPKIGITADLVHNASGPPEQALLPYCNVVLKAGGTPVIVPFVDEVDPYANALDGWLVTGGKDIPPEEYGEQSLAESDVLSPVRFGFEKRFWKVLERTGKPVLGICYGCQFINVMCGGALYQHIPEVFGNSTAHRGTGGETVFHPVEVYPGTKLSNILNARYIEPVSSHHQAVRKVGNDLRVCAKAPDGVIEGIESQDERWLVGVQWHPERTPEDVSTQRLLKAFVDACRGIVS